MSADRTPLRTLIGGRWAVSWQGYLLAWPWAVLFIFSTSPTVWATGTLPERIIRGVIVGTLAYIPVGLVAWLASISVFRNRRSTPVPVALVALVGGIAWTTRSLAMIGYLEMANLPSDASPSLRLLAGFIQGAFAFVLTAWLLAKLTSFYEERRRLIDTLVQEELANEHLHERIQDLQTRIVHQVRTAVDGTAQSMSTQTSANTPTPHDVEVLAQATKQISQDLARNLWDEAARTARINPLTIVRSTVANRPFTYWALIPGALLGVLALPIYWPLEIAVLAVVTLTVTALVIASLANFTCPRLVPSKALAVYLASLTLLLSTAFVMYALIHLLDLTPTGGSGLLWAVAVNYGVFFPLISAGAHIGRAQHDVLQQLRKSISQVEIDSHALNREESRLRRDLALALHGGLQADLTASAMRAQQALDQGDAASARQTLDEATNLIKQRWLLPDRAHADLRSTARAVVESWEGFVNIELHIAVAHEPSTRTIANIKEVLLEGIGNAIRHGRAKNITITITDHTGALHITITDDGTGVTGSRIGLGSAMFDDIAPNAWSLTRTSTGGSTLTVDLTTPAKT